MPGEDEPSEDKPLGGVRLEAGFGEGRSTPQSARPPAELAFRLLIVGDFGGRGDGRLRDISGEDISSLLASFGAVVEMEAPNRLGSRPPALAVRLPIASIRDLDPRTIGARIPQIAKAEQLSAAFANSRSAADLGPLANDPGLDRVVAALESEGPRSRLASPATLSDLASAGATDGDDSVDRLLGMIELPTSAAQPDVAKAAVSAFVSSLAKTPQAGSVPEAVGQLLAEQARDISTHASWLGVEAAWRSLRLILAARASRGATRIELCEVRRPAIADLLQSEAFEDAVAGAPHGPLLGAILVLGAFGRSDKDFDELDRLAQAAEKLETPVIVSLNRDFFGAPPESVAVMDNPGALLEGPGYAAWRGLRGRDESRLLFGAWNDVVLRPGAGDASPLWGEPGAVIAAQILRSLARTGWPTEIIGAEAALGGLEVAEVEIRAGRRTAIPLRALIDPGVARDLGREGIICLACRPDRDCAWLTRAPSMHRQGATAEQADQKVMENFDSLPFRFVSTCFENLLRRHAETLSAQDSDDAVAGTISRLVEDVLLTTGAGASAHATPVAPSREDDESSRRFELSIRLGEAVMSGFRFSFEIAL